MGHPARLFIVQPARAGTLTAHPPYRWSVFVVSMDFEPHEHSLSGGSQSSWGHRQRYDLPVTAEQCADLRRRASEEF